jgi:hypothetical protein
MGIKTKLRFHFTAIKMAIIKHKKVIDACKDAEEGGGIFIYCGWKVN